MGYRRGASNKPPNRFGTAFSATKRRSSAERLQTSAEVELVILEGALESRNKLAAKNTPEHFDGKKERVV